MTVYALRILGWHSRWAWSHQASRQVSVAWTCCQTVIRQYRLSASSTARLTCTLFVLQLSLASKCFTLNYSEATLKLYQSWFEWRLEFLSQHVVPVDVSEEEVRLQHRWWHVNVLQQKRWHVNVRQQRWQITEVIRACPETFTNFDRAWIIRACPETFVHVFLQQFLEQPSRFIRQVWRKVQLRL